MKRHDDLVQGTPEWHALRARHFCASDAPAMLGCHLKGVSRAELLHMKVTGDEREVSSFLQRIFDDGHLVEATARPLVEAHIDESLYPTVCTEEIDGLPLLASLDGITMDESLIWECKSRNAELIEQIRNRLLHPHYWSQLEHQLLVVGAERVYFTAGASEEDAQGGLFYSSDPMRRRQIIDGWKLFAADLSNYKPPVHKPQAVAEPISDLPALAVEISGRVIASNLDEWRAIVIQRIDGINRSLNTDQEFADAESMVKFLDAGEKRIALVKAEAQSQAVPIDELFRTLDDVSAKMRTVRLELDRLVKARKEEVRGEIAARGKVALAEYIAELNAHIGRPLMPVIPADFGVAMKGRKTVKSLNDAVDTELTRARLEATAVAARIEANLKALADAGAEHASLFPDLKAICTKAEDDFALLVKSRIDAQKAREEARIEAERQRIRQEEEARAAAVAAATVAATPHVATAPPAFDTTVPTTVTGAANVAALSPTATSSSSEASVLLGQINQELNRMSVVELRLALDQLREIRKRRAA